LATSRVLFLLIAVVQLTCGDGLYAHVGGIQTRKFAYLESWWHWAKFKSQC
jgi:hypothetical protein